MNRTEQKCIFASAGFHLLLGLILLIGPAFFTSQKPPAEFELLKFDPDILTDKLGQHGGTPMPAPVPRQSQETPPAPQPPTPPQQRVAPVQKVEKVIVPQAEPKIVESEKSDPDAFEKKPKKPAKPVPDLTPVTRKVDKLKEKKAAEERERAAAEAAANEQRERLDAIGKNLASLGKNLSSSTPINISPGVGGGGPSSANYRDYVASKYWEAWIAPERTARENAVVKARVTIARDGTILSARITESSGDTATDASVQRTLERVKYIRPFPDGATENERTYPLAFDLSAKRLEG